MLSGGARDVGPKEFLVGLISNDVKFDKKDKDVFLMLVLGTWPLRRRSLLRELFSDQFVFSCSTDAKNVFSEWLELLSDVCTPPNAKLDRPTGVNLFWQNIVQPLSAYHDKTSAGGAGKDGKSYSLKRKELTVAIKDEADLAFVDGRMTWEIYRCIVLAGLKWLARYGDEIINSTYV